jgi:hypothetical protein
MKPRSPRHIARFSSERMVIAAGRQIAARGAHEIRTSFIVMTIPTA